MKLKKILTPLFVFLASSAHASQACKSALSSNPSQEDIWSQNKASFLTELYSFKKSSKLKQRQEIETASLKLEETIRKVSGARDIGYHFNLHGGHAQDFVDKGGIIAKSGDAANNYAHMQRHASQAKRVYFFRDVISSIEAKHPELLLMPGNHRMGDTLVIFNLDNVEKIATDSTDIYIEFGNAQRNIVGVPASEFIVPPIKMFQTKKHLGLWRLTWNQQSYITLLYLQKYIESQYPI